MALPATDNFNRPNASTLGSNWTQDTGFGIWSNYAYPGSWPSIAYWNADSFASDQYASGVIKFLMGNWLTWGPAVRVSLGKSYSLCAHDTDKLTIRKNYEGTVTDLSTVTYTHSAGDVLRIEISGANLVGFVNGVSKVTASDSSITTGAAGLAGYSGGDCDSWEGGNLTTTNTAGPLIDSGQLRSLIKGSLAR